MEKAPDDSEEYEVVYLDCALGWGGMEIGPDGYGHPMPEAEALTLAISEWVNIPEHLEDAVAICLRVLDRPEPAMRASALAAFSAIARRYGRLPQRDAVTRAVDRIRSDMDPAVRRIAADTAHVLAELSEG